MVPCSLENVAATCADLVRPLADQRGVDLQCTLEKAPCIADPDRIGQVVTNLLSNAIAHAPASGRVRLTSGCLNGNAWICVADDGPGIPSEALPRIFERFYRADKSRSANNGGAGLGLAISKVIIDAHGGRIDVETSQGKGAAFKLVLPSIS
jgi:signal transduction histidine kinase